MFLLDRCLATNQGISKQRVLSSTHNNTSSFSFRTSYYFLHTSLREQMMPAVASPHASKSDSSHCLTTSHKQPRTYDMDVWSGKDAVVEHPHPPTLRSWDDVIGWTLYQSSMYHQLDHQCHVPPPRAPHLIHCSELPPFVPQGGEGVNGVAIFQLPNFAKVNPEVAVMPGGLKMLYEPLARLFRDVMQLPFLDFGVGHPNFKFRPHHRGRSNGTEDFGPFAGWREVIEAYFVDIVRNTGHGISVRAHHRDGSMHMVSGVFVAWDKHKAMRTMTEAFTAHFAATLPYAPSRIHLSEAVSAAECIEISVNPPTMQLRVATPEDAVGIVNYFTSNAVLCDVNYLVWVEEGRHILGAAVQSIQQNEPFKVMLANARLPRCLVNAELRELSRWERWDEQQQWEERVDVHELHQLQEPPEVAATLGEEPEDEDGDCVSLREADDASVGDGGESHRSDSPFNSDCCKDAAAITFDMNEPGDWFAIAPEIDNVVSDELSQKSAPLPCDNEPPRPSSQPPMIAQESILVAPPIVSYFVPRGDSGEMQMVWRRNPYEPLRFGISPSR